MPDIFEVIKDRKKNITSIIPKNDDTAKSIEKLYLINTQILELLKSNLKEKSVPSITIDDVKKEVASSIPPQIDLKALTKSIREEIIRSIQIPVIPEKTVEKIITKEIVSEKNDGPVIDSDARKEIEKYKEELKSIKDLLSKLNKKPDPVSERVFIPPMLPNYSNENGTYLQALNGVLKWGAVSSSSSSAESGTFVIGPDSTEGSWRLTIDGNNLLVQRYETGTWVEKAVFEP